MITYTWNILELSTIPQVDENTDVVVDVFWSLTGSDDEYSGNFRSITKFTLDSSKGFTPFNELTEEQVIGWVKSSISDMRLDQIKNSIVKQIEIEKSNKPIPQTQPLPWQGEL